MIDAPLFGADVRRAHLYGGVLGADRRQASLGEAHLSDADGLGANVLGTDPSRADLLATDLESADLMTDC